ncbi:UNVERIFIED_CONTAM: hypothetical protein FKN15_007323 [Acipenser sinensis]
MPWSTSSSQASVPSANYTGEAGVSTHPEDSSSSIIALVVVLTLTFAIIMTSLVTFYCHKSELRAKKQKKAQEEYEKDHEKSNKQKSTAAGGGLQNP